MHREDAFHQETQSCLELICVDMIIVMPGHFITHKYCVRVLGSDLDAF